MIADLDRAIEALLKQELPAAIAQQVTISFAPPDTNFPPQSVALPAIDLFLYDMRENRELRTTERRVVRENNQATIYQFPMRVDCSYLITAWSSDAAPRPMEDEHRLLGEVLMILMRFPRFPNNLLRGTLVDLTPEITTEVLQPGRLQSIAEFWQALGGKPKVALNYTLTISIPVAAPVEAPLVGRSTVEGKPDTGQDEA